MTKLTSKSGVPFRAGHVVRLENPSRASKLLDGCVEYEVVWVKHIENGEAILRRARAGTEEITVDENTKATIIGIAFPDAHSGPISPLEDRLSDESVPHLTFQETPNVPAS